MSGTTANTGYTFPITATDGTVAYNNVLTPNTVPSSDGSGVLFACGYNVYGGLGNGTTINCSSPIQIGSLNTWKQISGSFYGIAAIKTDGTLWTWGRNNYGQLGNGTVTDYSSPIQVGPLSNWSQVASAFSMSTAIKTDGTLWTWGQNNYGQLGNGTVINYSSPIQVGSLTNWSKVASGNYGIAAIKTDGTLWTCGFNNYGQLGNGTVNVYYSSPIQIGALTNWKQISSGDYHTAAIKTDGTLWGWGFNGTGGALGNGTTTNYSSPIQIGALTTWSQVSCGYFFTAAIKTDGTLWACGYNGTGALGNGTTTNYSSPIQVGLLTNWSQVAGCYRFTTAIKTDGTLWIWGRNDYGQLGNGTIVYYSSPIQIGSLTNWSKVAQGQAQTLNALANYYTVSIPTIVDLADVMVPKDLFLNSGLWTWGYNASGLLGNGTTTPYSSPIQIGSLTNWKQVSAGEYITAAIKTDGTLWAWGNDSYGALGSQTNTGFGYSSPIQIGSLTYWKQVSCGRFFTFGIPTNNTLWSWGKNANGQLGNGTTTDYSSPIQIGSLTNWKQVAGGYAHSAAIKTDGTLWAWGYNNYGQLGLGNNIAVGVFGITNQSSPIQVAGGATWSTVDPNTQILNYFSLVRNKIFLGAAIGSNGSLWTWGYNNYGQLGNGTVNVYYSSPIQVGSLTNWKQVSCGYFNMFAIKTDGTLWACGYNSNAYGTIPINSSSSVGYSSPIQIGALTNWKQVSCGRYSGVAVKTDGTLWTWGTSQYGGLGNGTVNVPYSSPIQIGSLTNWSQVCIGTNGPVMAVKTDGTLWSWGDGSFGAIGNGTTISYSSPIQVGSLTNWKQVAISERFVAAVKTDGSLWTWGYNNYGQLGNGTNINQYSSPIQIGLLTNWKQVSCGYSHMAAVKTDGTLWTWGWNGDGAVNGGGQLGNGTSGNYYSSPIQVGSLTNWSQTFCGGFSTYAYTTSGVLYSFGDNGYGQLGAIQSYTNNTSSPIQVGSLTNWKQVSCGYYHTAAIKTDGTLWSCGYNGYGGLGNGATDHYSSPIQVGSLTNWKQISGGQYHTAAIKTDGTLWTCGYNSRGQLGNGTININYSSPVQVGSLTNWKQVSCFFSNLAAVKTDGTLWACGYGYFGQLGNGTTLQYSSPIQIGSLTSWKQVTSGRSYKVAIQSPDYYWNQ